MAITAIVVGLGSFFGGMKYEQSKQQTNLPNFAGRGNFMGQGAAMRQGGGNVQNGQGFATGELLSKDATSMTLKLQDGGSKLIYFSSSTQVMKSSEGTTDDLNVGQNLMINGKTNQDGSITAQTVQMRPEMPQPGSVQLQKVNE